ncbi:DUF11 domain-containing protein [Microbacterium excoecariae]|uniref:DUF11 domain-containing protein n=1 Tax=Microbacterium excoecariae TaxID=2715210 RepID=UPI001407BDDE|nr:DUF11 domain-containing protein [Microbacterium excoecariae]NHI16433.1 DUF11 domain-containing protein [Microbacterium excoecariae]
MKTTRATTGPRRLLAILTAGVLAAALSIGVPMAAEAATVGGIATSFQIDGDKAGPNDWDALYGPGTTPGAGYPTTGIVDSTSATEYCVAPGVPDQLDPTVAGPGSQSLNTNPWIPVAGAAPNKKSDLCDSGAAYEIVDVNGQPHVILYEYWTRAPEGTGDLSVDFLFEGGPAGRAGDRLLHFDYNPNTENASVVGLAWNGSAWVASGGLVFEAAVGTNPDFAGSQDSTFGEFAVDLTASGFLPADECATFTTGAIVTQTGNSQTFNGQLQDFLIGQAPLTLSSCGAISVEKVTTGAVPEGVTFPYVIDQEDGLAVHGAAGAVGPVADTDGTANSITAEIGAGDTHTWSDVLAQPDFRVAELTEGLPAGVTGLSIVCTYQDPFQVGSPTVQATVWQDGAYTGEDIVVSATSLGLMTPECVITNQVTSLTLDKIVVNDHGGQATGEDFPLRATAEGGTEALAGTDANSAAGSDLTALVAPGAYTLSEESMAGYTASEWSCEGGTLEGNVVTLAAGESAVCAITNDDQPATLTLVKDVTNDDGGTAVDTDFVLMASGPEEISGSEGDESVTNAAVPAGSYALGEEAFAGYEMTGVACWTTAERDEQLALDGETLALGNGESAYCEISNDDLPGSLELVKIVDNGDGGTAEPTDWTLSAEGPSGTLEGAGGVTPTEVTAGTYTLSETGGPDGYEPGMWVCVGADADGDEVVVPNGGTVTCTIINDDIAPTLTLVKQVVNDDGGTADATAWTLSADGADATVSGTTGSEEVTIVPVPAGTYVLGEDGPTGYDAGDWDCTGGALEGTELTLAVGENAVCTIVNDDIAPTLALVKMVTNDDGGTAEPEDFLLTASGPQAVAGYGGAASQPVPAGVYTLGESGLDGYTMGAWSCTDGTLDGATLTLSVGQTAVCTIVNDDVAPTLTLVKEVVNDDGGTAEPGDFDLAADGPTPLSGPSGDAAVTDQPVAAGTYTLSESGPEGYEEGEWSCEGADAEAGTVDLGPGDVVTCTISNDDIAPTLALVKIVVNDDGGTATPADVTLSAVGPTELWGNGSVPATPVPAGVYTLAETPLAGYAAGDWSCTAGSLEGEALTLDLAEDAVCTIINDDLPATLTLVKEVVNDDGGELDTDAFTLTASGPVNVSGVTGDAEITEAVVPAGAYQLSEAGPDGYAPGTWTCDGAPVTDEGLVSIPNGGVVTCVIVNDDIAPRLTLVKEVVNDDGGEAAAMDWTLTADGPVDAVGVTGDEFVTDQPVLAGDYELSEAGPGGYAAGAWSCEGGTLDGSTLTLEVGENVVCTIVNDDIAPVLTLVKEVVNDDGGEMVAADFTLTASGPDEISGAGGTDATAVTAGEYTLSETGPAGYAAGEWSCEGGSLSGAMLDLAVGDEAVCTIVNDDLPIDLALTKDDGGATAKIGQAFDYTITVENVGERAVDAGEPVVVSDRLPDGLHATALPEGCAEADGLITCEIDGAALVPGGSVVLVLTVVFDDDAAAGTYENIAWVTTEDDPAPESPTCPEDGAALAAAAGADPANNVDCEQTSLLIPELDAVKSVWEWQDGSWEPSDGTVDFGDALRYEITLTTGGNAPSEDVVVVDELMDGLTSLTPAECTVTCQAVYDDGVHTIRIDAIDPDQTVVISFEALVPAAPDLAPGQDVTRSFENAAAFWSADEKERTTNTVTVTAKDSRPEPAAVPMPDPVTPALLATGGSPFGPWLAGCAIAALLAGLVTVALSRRWSSGGTK